MLLLTRIYNNLPTNRKTAEVDMKIHKFDHAVMSEVDFDDFKKWLTSEVEAANERYPRTKKLYVSGRGYGGIVVRLDGSEQCLSISFDQLGRKYKEIIEDLTPKDGMPPAWDID